MQRRRNAVDSSAGRTQQWQGSALDIGASSRDDMLHRRLDLRAPELMRMQGSKGESRTHGVVGSEQIDLDNSLETVRRRGLDRRQEVASRGAYDKVNATESTDSLVDRRLKRIGLANVGSDANAAATGLLAERRGRFGDDIASPSTDYGVRAVWASSAMNRTRGPTHVSSSLGPGRNPAQRSASSPRKDGLSRTMPLPPPVQNRVERQVS